MQEDPTSVTNLPPPKRSSLEDYFLQPNMLNLIPAAMYICGMDGTIQQFNEQAVRLWGRSPTINDNEDRFCGAFRLYLPDGNFLPHTQPQLPSVLELAGYLPTLKLLLRGRIKARYM